MIYTVSQRSPQTMTTEDLIGELDGFTALAADLARRLSLVLKELRARRIRHTHHFHTVLMFFAEIADNRLDAEAAVLLANTDRIRAVLPLPAEQQRAIARGEEVPVAVRLPSGAITHDRLPIRRMDDSTRRRAFGPKGIRPLEEQTAMIQAENRVERHGMITILRDEVMLKIGNQRIRPEELRQPLLALGFRLDALSEAPQ